jgi:hypothetical protein
MPVAPMGEELLTAQSLEVHGALIVQIDQALVSSNLPDSLG